MHSMLTTGAVATLFITLGQPPAVQPKRTGGDVHAPVTYTDSGKVDAAHRIWAFLF
jgi:hypothetical protein